jgi:hypothetical protein
MTMRAQRRFRFSSSEFALEVRFSPAIISPYVPAATAPAVSICHLASEDDPLPDPEPSPGPYPGDDPPITHPELPPSGPIGPGTS